MTSFSEILGNNSDIAGKITDEYKQAAIWLPFSAVQISSVFDHDELKLVAELVAEMQSAKDANQRTALLIRKADKYSAIIVKLLGLAGIL